MAYEDDIVRSNQVLLKGGTTESGSTSLLTAEFPDSAWRTVEVVSREGKPFELELKWSVVTASGSRAVVTAASAARVCVFARSIQVFVSNLSSDGHTVIGQVADGFTQSANVWEHRATVSAQTPVNIPIPPFAAVFFLHLGGHDTPPGTTITIFDGTGTARAQFSAANQPAGGIPLGGAGRIEVTTQSNMEVRGVFALSI